jgi:exodeoxyribonuclease VII small subunit
LAKKKQSVKSDAPEEITFERGLERLEQIVHELEEGQLGLSESLGRYEEGVKYLRRCYHLLEGAERKVELLSRVDEDGTPSVEPFDQEQRTLEEKADSRSRRRSRSPRNSGGEPSGGDDDIDESGGLF